MWKHLRERFHTVKVRVLHPRIPKSSSVDILRGVLEGSRLSPTLFGIFVADLIHELKVQFPNATINHNGGLRWIGGILYVDDLCLISADARELQMMINTCQQWSEKARMQLSVDKTKIMCFLFPSGFMDFFLQFHIQVIISRTLYMCLQIPPNDALVFRSHFSMTQRGSWLSSKFPADCSWFLVFGLLCRRTVSISITTDMHTSGVQ